MEGAARLMEVMMEKRRLKLGIKRGALRSCPNCGRGRLFSGYLAVQPVCDYCGHANANYRADDAAPYFTILLVGHLVIAPILTLGIIGTWSLGWLYALIFPLIATVTLALLPFVKGAVIGALWSLNRDEKDAAGLEGEIS
jgi:uncharacterized protein (DUF983 family)